MDKSLFFLVKKEISNILSRFVDNKIWILKEKDENIQILHFAENENQINIAYQKEYLDDIFLKSPEKYKFIFHIFSSYIYQVDDAILEPTYGWIILRNYVVYKYSFPLVGDPWRPDPIMPSFFKFKLSFAKESYFDEAISIRFGWENYYHFFNDVLGQIFILEDEGVPNHIPLIVPHYFKTISYVQDFLKLSSFIKRKIIIQQKNEYIRVKKLIVAKDSFFSKGVKEVVKTVDYLRELDRNDKVFIYRPLAHGRSIINNSEIIEIALKYGFTPVDSSKLSLSQQITFFSGISKIVGIHGAGLTNIIFRQGHTLSLLEIFPDKSLTPNHYKHLSDNLDYTYNFLIGDKGDEKYNFYLPIDKFELALQNFK